MSVSSTNYYESSESKADQPMKPDQPVMPEQTEEQADEAYRELSKPAMISLILGIVSIPSALAVPLLVLPVVGFFLGIIGLALVRRYPHELTGKTPAIFGIVLSAGSFTFGGGLHLWEYHTEVPEGYQRISFYDLEPERGAESPIPSTALGLNDEKIFVKGYVLPGEQQRGIKTFILVPDMGTCCFGGDPDPSDMIEVTLNDPLRVNYSLRRLKLTGVFRVSQSPKFVGEKRRQVYYRLTGDGVK